jgi:hypothetical protein
MTDVDDDDDAAPVPTIGAAEVADGDPHAHPIQLYVPDLSSMTGWSVHEVPVPEPPTQPRRFGFRQ